MIFHASMSLILLAVEEIKGWDLMCFFKAQIQTETQRGVEWNYFENLISPAAVMNDDIKCSATVQNR